MKYFKKIIQPGKGMYVLFSLFLYLGNNKCKKKKLNCGEGK
jgi:hypothetical protein